MPFTSVLAHGSCAGVPCDDDDRELLPEERAFAASLAAVRRRDWIGGRVALRRAAQSAGFAIAAAILSDDRGAPRLPSGLVGSVSHKDGVAVALVARSDGWTVGIDLERTTARRLDITNRVLRLAERVALEVLDGAERARALMLRFSLKEAVYKAIDPHLRRYVGLQEVAVWPDVAGTARVEMFCPDGAALLVEGAWIERDGLWLTTAQAKHLDTQ